jgi:hypothetical protein
MGFDASVAAVSTPLNQPPGQSPREFVDAKQFCSLAISNRTLVRWDDRSNCLRGLHDPALGVTYVIHEEQLFSERNPRAAESGL